MTGSPTGPEERVGLDAENPDGDEGIGQIRQAFRRWLELAGIFGNHFQGYRRQDSYDEERRGLAVFENAVRALTRLGGHMLVTAGMSGISGDRARGERAARNERDQHHYRENCEESRHQTRV